MDEIGKMLENADTPAERVLLLVLYKIQQNLSEMSKDFMEHRGEFAAHRVEFDKHVVVEQKLWNKGIGGWIVMSVVLAASFSFSGWYISRHILDRDVAQQSAIDSNTNRITALETLSHPNNPKTDK